MTTLQIVTRKNAPMQLSDFMNLPSDDSFENTDLFYYKVKKDGNGGIKLEHEKTGRRFKLLKEALMEAKDLEESKDDWGSYLEFGFSSGRTLNFIAAIADNTFVYGFESGNGIGENKELQERPFAYTKTIDKDESVMEDDITDEYGADGELISKKGLIRLALKPRTSETQKPFVPFTPLCNVLLYMGDIETTLPVYLDKELKKQHRPNHVSFVFIDMNDDELTDKILHMLAGSVVTGRTIIVTDHALSIDTLYTQPVLPIATQDLVPLTQDTVDLRLGNFIQTPNSTGALVDDKSENFDPAGRNILHFKSTNRNPQFNGNRTMIPLRRLLTEANAEALMSDSEVLQHSIEVARNNFAGEEGRAKFYLEFGVCSGRTINFIATLLEKDEELFGFDSGTGLPMEWRYKFPKGMFRYTKRIEKNIEQGKLLFSRIEFSDQEKIPLDEKVFIPFIPHQRVKLVMGLIEDTLDDFIAQYLEHRGEQACVPFVHIDTDLKSAAQIILRKLNKYIKRGKTVVLFDEAFNFDGTEGENAPVRYDEWKNHEFYALNNFRGDDAWHPIAYNQNGQQLAVIFN